MKANQRESSCLKAQRKMLFCRHHQILRPSEGCEAESKETADTASLTGAATGHSTESETESSPSGYGTETSDSSASTDTDIDTIVDEYREEACVPTRMREYPKTNKNKPSR